MHSNFLQRRSMQIMDCVRNRYVNMNIICAIFARINCFLHSNMCGIMHVMVQFFPLLQKLLRNHRQKLSIIPSLQEWGWQLLHLWLRSFVLLWSITSWYAADTYTHYACIYHDQRRNCSDYFQGKKSTAIRTTVGNVGEPPARSAQAGSATIRSVSFKSTTVTNQL